MAGKNYTYGSSTSGINDLGGGLNSTASALNLADNEMSDLLNVDFDVFGSIKKRNGYLNVNETAIGSGATCVGLYDAKFLTSEYLVGIFDNLIYKMDDLDGTFDNITGSLAETFTGTGLDDLTPSGTYAGSINIAYKIAIDAEGTPDTFEWFKDGVSQASGVAITGSAQVLDNGISITFGATTGHTDTEYWELVLPTIVTSNDNSLFSFSLLDETLVMTNGVNPPIKWDGGGNCEVADIPANLSAAKFVTMWNNYMFYANCKISAAWKYSRFYWSNLKDPTTWTSTDWIDVSPGDGTRITGIAPLGDRLVVFKENTIHNVFFTGDSDIPFIVNQSQSDVGAIGGYSIERIDNGLLFWSGDGIYYYDGNNSTKISDKINTTLGTLARNRFEYITSGQIASKDIVWWAVAISGGSSNNRIITYNTTKLAFSVYDGIYANYITSFMVSGIERLYFGDYSGFLYRGDYGTNDYPAGTQTAINAYFKTKWFHFGNIVDKKGVYHVVVYYQISSSTVNVAHSFDLDNGDQFTQRLYIGTEGTLWDYFLWDEGLWAVSGGKAKRLEMRGRGRLMRIHISNNTLSETFQFDGIGFYPHEVTVS